MRDREIKAIRQRRKIWKGLETARLAKYSPFERYGFLHSHGAILGSRGEDTRTT